MEVKYRVILFLKERGGSGMEAGSQGGNGEGRTKKERKEASKQARTCAGGPDNITEVLCTIRTSQWYCLGQCLTVLPVCSYCSG